MVIVNIRLVSNGMPGERTLNVCHCWRHLIVSPPPRSGTYVIIWLFLLLQFTFVYFNQTHKSFPDFVAILECKLVP